MDNERRRHKRLRTKATADISLTDGRRYAFAEVGDFSESGCYIETMYPLEIGTAVELTITLKELETSVRLSGTVRTCDRGVGMGVEFTGGQSEELRASLTKLEGSTQ